MYYKLKDLEKFVDLKPRMLKYRISKLKEKYKNSDLLYKSGRQWNIHHTLVKLFERKKNVLEKYNFKSFVSISFQDSLEIEYLIEIMNMLYNQMNLIKKTTILYVIEKNKANNNHLHFLTNWEKIKVDESFIYNSLKLFKMNFDMQKIYHFNGINQYLNKAILFKGLLV